MKSEISFTLVGVRFSLVGTTWANFEMGEFN